MGWFQNLINRIKGIKETKSLPDGLDNINKPNNIFDGYRVNLEAKEGAKKEIIELAEKGINIDFIKAKAIDRLEGTGLEFSDMEIAAAYNIGTALSNGLTREEIDSIGGMENLYERMMEQAEINGKNNPYGYNKSSQFMYMPNAKSMVNLMKQELAEKTYRDSFRLRHDQRKASLNQLYQGALEYIGPYKNNINENILLDYMMQKGYSFELGGENPSIEEVDLRSIINLATSVNNGYINPEEVGGPVNLIEEMAVDAKIAASQAGYKKEKLGTYGANFVSVQNTFSHMPKENEKGISK